MQEYELCEVAPLRDTTHVRGFPKLKPHQEEIVRVGNLLVDVTMIIVWVCLDYQCYFTVENPFPSWIWLQSEMLRVVYQSAKKSI